MEMNQNSQQIFEPSHGFDFDASNANFISTEDSGICVKLLIDKLMNENEPPATKKCGFEYRDNTKLLAPSGNSDDLGLIVWIKKYGL